MHPVPSSVSGEIKLVRIVGMTDARSAMTAVTYREQIGLPLAETLIRDSRFALRRLRMAPAFTLATTLTLALGIGATTSILILANAVLFKSLPVARTEYVTAAWSGPPARAGDHPFGMSEPVYRRRVDPEAHRTIAL
jgi:hypothetical protein